jgi:response regulator RpfG family c-di-GMP phosphodiesterase
MAAAASQASYENEEARKRAVDDIESLEIHTDDEIENLYYAIVKNTQDMAATTENMAKYIAQMQKQSQTIGKLQNGVILVLADMVESRDQNTGEHVRKTAAYTGVIMRQLRKAHIYEDQLTDEYIEDVMHSAPLHDVGKIQVPDAILNKPGRLTDEEFAIMKTHTTAGSDIIQSAISMVSEDDSGYLIEARNLAHYHHEKWNGSGYPDGLSGTDIPLSARIMAVADVFDALVSKRSYKDGFPFEKAMTIIEEGRGSHFDPAIVDAFMSASDEVRSIMESHMGRV